MSGKFALFFLVAVCLTQGYEARVSEPRGLLEDAINAIKSVVKKVEDAISEITAQIPEIIKNLENKIKEIISNIHIDEIIQSIEDKINESIDKILALAGVDPDAVRDCIDAEKEAVKQLKEETIAGIAACKQAADDEVAKLAKETEELKTRADKLVKDSTAAIKQCIEEHGINIIEGVKCLKGHLEVLMADTDALLAQVKTTIAVANDKLVKVPVALTKCVAQVNGDVLSKQKVIIDNFKQCVDSHSQKL